MTAVASPDVKRTLFECLWCHSVFDKNRFSSAEKESGPNCLVCGDLLERMKVDVYGTEEISRVFEDETIAGFGAKRAVPDIRWRIEPDGKTIREVEVRLGGRDAPGSSAALRGFSKTIAAA